MKYTVGIECSYASPNSRTFLSKVLVSWHTYWSIDMDFSSGLLKQFIEDMVEFEGEMKVAKKPEVVRDCSEKILAMVQVFNTVLSCLKSKGKAVTILPADSADWCGTILDCLLMSLEKHFSEDLLIAGQHSFVMLIERIEGLFNRHMEKLILYIRLVEENFEDMTFSGQIESIRFFTKMFSISNYTKARPDILKLITGQQSPILRTVFSYDQAVTNASVNLFKALLNTKDIKVLQVRVIDHENLKCACK